jgi:HK97 family phage major capsid protein
MSTKQINNLFERNQLLAKSKSTVERVRLAGRSLTSTESAEVDQALNAVTAYDTASTEAAKSFSTWRTGTDAEMADADGEPMFSDAVKSGFVNAARSKGSFGATVSIKSALLGGGLPTTGTTVSPMPPGLGSFPLRNLFTQADAQGPVVRYYRLGAGSAAVVAEAGVKPDSGVTSTAVDAPLIKIASVFTVSDELAEDASFLIAALQQEVIRGTLVRENIEIVTALSGASGIFTGTGTAATALDVVATAVGAAEARDGITPGALVLNPVDLATMRKAKASTAGSYFIDPLSSAPSSVHGVPLVSTAAVAAGTMLLVSQGAGVFYTRGGVRVESGFVGDNWVRNLISVRVEERVLPAIVRPSLITLITLT